MTIESGGFWRVWWVLRSHWIWLSVMMHCVGSGGCRQSTLLELHVEGATNVPICSDVVVTAELSGTDMAIEWSVVEEPFVFLEELESTRIRFRVPAVVRDTVFTIKGEVKGSGRHVVVATTKITALAPHRPSDLADGMVHDCGRFSYGVASGDPRTDSIVLWTALNRQGTSSEEVVQWVVARDPQLKSVVRSGVARTTSASDYTVRVLVDGLEPGQSYYYRFETSEGVGSSLGRTRTLPGGEVERVRLAVLSCSSVYSGFFNAYARIAERDELDLVLHLGDYIYDFVDEQEQVRVPSPYPEEPVTLEGWRQRHRYYLADPNLRRARAAHPWVAIWDNHDLNAHQNAEYGGGLQAFREWLPMRQSDSGSSAVGYRELRFGDLIDLFVLDVLLHRDKQRVPGSDEYSILGEEQYDWLENEVSDSLALWRVLGSQKPFATMRVNPAFAEGKTVFSEDTWDGYPADRSRVMTLMADVAGGNNVIASGDAHISVAMNLSVDMHGGSTGGLASAGVELLPSSISRGNLDEQLGSLTGIMATIVDDTLQRNPHHRYLELTKHGYGILDFTPHRVVAEIWYSDILSLTREEELGVSLTSPIDSNAWSVSP